MTKYSIVIPILIIWFGSVLFAGEYRADESIHIGKSDTIHQDLTTANRYLDVDGFISSDLYAASQNVSITGQIGDDAIVACQHLRLTGAVNDLLFGAAQNIIIDGKVGGDLMTFGSEVRLSKESQVKGNLFFGAGVVRIEGGTVGGEVRGKAGTVYLNGTVGKKVDIEAENVKIGPDFKAAKEVRLSVTGKVTSSDGEIIQSAPPNMIISHRYSHHFYEGVFFYWSLVSMFIVGLILLLVFKRPLRSFIDEARDRTLVNSGIGLLLLIVTPIVAVILMILILTIPIALILIAFYLIVLYLSSIITGFVLGDYILGLIQRQGDKRSLILALIIGIIVVALVGKIPFIGWLFTLEIICFGGGSLVVYLTTALRKPATSEQ